MVKVHKECSSFEGECENAGKGMGRIGKTHVLFIIFPSRTFRFFFLQRLSVLPFHLSIW